MLSFIKCIGAFREIFCQLPGSHRNFFNIFCWQSWAANDANIEQKSCFTKQITLNVFQWRVTARFTEPLSWWDERSAGVVGLTAECAPTGRIEVEVGREAIDKSILSGGRRKNRLCWLQHNYDFYRPTLRANYTRRG